MKIQFVNLLSTVMEGGHYQGCYNIGIGIGIGIRIRFILDSFKQCCISGIGYF